jgi:hypothetical protein
MWDWARDYGKRNSKWELANVVVKVLVYKFASAV